MKKLLLKSLFVVLGVVLLNCYCAQAQSFDNIVQAFKSGNASVLAASFQANVEITIKDAGNSYSKSQAEMVLKNFFITNRPNGFSVVHQGTSPEGSKYFIGTLSTPSGNYRTYVYAKAANGALTIQEIRLENQ